MHSAAGPGDAEAQHNLGVLYYKGDGVKQDYASSCQWWEKAAAQGFMVSNSTERDGAIFISDMP
ncbi:MAG: SEL1-like repeat protein [Desulfarculales bacterium]|nr:SEL1-like repeat protein [Desulfarculales bacterium]